MKYSFFLTAWLFALVAPSWSAAQTDSTYRLEICVVHLIKDIDVPARETGLLKELVVEQNDAVELDQMLGKIDDQVAQRSREQAELKHSIAKRQFEDDTEIKIAEKKMKLTEEEYKTNYNLYLKGSKTRFEAQRSLYQSQTSELEHTAAMNNQQLAGIQANAEMVTLQATNDSIERHVIKSPVQGFVLQVYKDAGEWVNAGEKILRVAPLSRLRVHGSISTDRFNPQEVDGKPVIVTLARARNEKVEFVGEVVLTSLENQGGTKYQVIAEVENRLDKGDKYFMLQPGSSVSMEIFIDGKLPDRALLGSR